MRVDMTWKSVLRILRGLCLERCLFSESKVLDWQGGASLPVKATRDCFAVKEHIVDSCHELWTENRPDAEHRHYDWVLWELGGKYEQLTLELRKLVLFHFIA